VSHPGLEKYRNKSPQKQIGTKPIAFIKPIQFNETIKKCAQQQQRQRPRGQESGDPAKRIYDWRDQSDMIWLNLANVSEDEEESECIWVKGGPIGGLQLEGPMSVTRSFTLACSSFLWQCLRHGSGFAKQKYAGVQMFVADPHLKRAAGEVQVLFQAEADVNIYLDCSVGKFVHAASPKNLAITYKLAQVRARTNRCVSVEVMHDTVGLSC
jgi:hypothetical protein